MFLFICSMSFWLDAAEAAQLRIRKELLAKQSDQALINVTGRFEHIQEITEKKDCKFQVSLRANEINVAVVGEFINACSTQLDPNEIMGLSRNGDIPIEGVFRIWFEQAGSIDDVFSEEYESEPYNDSTPKHAVEIDPITQAGERKFYDTIRLMEKADFEPYSTSALQRLLKRKVTIEEYTGDDGEPYIAIESGGGLPSHFHLKAVLRAKPLPTQDGYSAQVDILDRRKVVASGIRIFSVEGTKANEALKTMKKGAEFSFWGITRMDGKKALKILDEDAGYHIPIPFEFVLLDIHK